jgi:hypothetical protein
MPQKVIAMKTNRYIKVRSFGKVKSGDYKKTIQTIKRFQKRVGYNKVLLEVHQQATFPNISNILELFSDLPQLEKFAVVVSDDHRAVIDVRYTENVARNRGLDMQIFSTPEDARAWLVF